MTSKIVVNNIESDAGVSTVFFNSDIGGTGGTLNVDGNLNVDGVLTYEDVTNIDSVGVVTARSGVNITGGDLTLPDAIIHTGDTNTRIRFPASDTVTVETAGNERLRIDSAGRLLLGSGAAALPKGSGAGSFDLDNGSITMCIGGNVNSTGRTNSTDKIARFTAPHYTNTEEPVLIVSSYNVSSSNAISYGGGSNLCNTANSHVFYTAADTTTVTGTERLRITSNGNIGVGGATGTDFSLLDGIVTNTANGSAGLLINSSSSSHNAYMSFGYGSGSGTSHADQFSAYIGRVGDNKLILGTNNTIRLNIDSSGRVGIQGDPTRALLEVRASGGSNTMLTALWGANEGTVTGALSDNTDKAVRMGIQHYDTDALPYAFLVGSSTSSANNLTFGGGTGLMNAATEIVFRTASNTTTTTGTERLRITSAGIHKISTAGSTQDGTFFSTLTINNTGSNTYSRFRFDRSGVARFGLTLRNDDKLCISNLYEGGSVTANDNAFVMDAYSKIGINETSPTARVDINHPHTEQGLVVRSRYGNIATAMVKFDGDPDSNGGDGNVLHLHGGNSRTDSEILHIDSTGVGDIFDIRGDGLTRVYKQLQLEHSSNTAKIIFNEYGANDPKAQIEMDQINGDNGQLRFYTEGSGSLTEKLRILNSGHVNIGGNYTQASYILQANGGIKGHHFTGESLSTRTGYKWGASGMYYLTLGGTRSGNGSSFTMFELTGMNNSKFVEIQISFAHAGGGSHGSYRRFVFTSNAYQGLNTLENVTSNYGGGGGFTINKPTTSTVRVVYNGSSAYADAYTLACEVKTSNSGVVFQNVDSAFS